MAGGTGEEHPGPRARCSCSLSACSPPWSGPGGAWRTWCLQRTKQQLLSKDMMMSVLCSESTDVTSQPTQSNDNCLDKQCNQVYAISDDHTLKKDQFLKKCALWKCGSELSEKGYYRDVMIHDSCVTQLGKYDINTTLCIIDTGNKAFIYPIFQVIKPSSILRSSSVLWHELSQGQSC